MTIIECNLDTCACILLYNPKTKDFRFKEQCITHDRPEQAVTHNRSLPKRDTESELENTNRRVAERKKPEFQRR